jgi:hypothetical protein
MGRLRWPWKKPTNAAAVKDRWSLDTRLLSWSRHDHLTLRDAVNGFVATGVSGGGKTSGPVAAVSRALLRAGFGGIFHAVKTDDADLALQWCKDTGRMDDVIFFGPKYPARFNFLDYELSRSGEGAGLTDNIVDLLLNVAEIRGRKSDKGGGENGGFFVNAEKQILRVSVDTLARAKGRVTVPDIHRLIMSAPTSREEFHSPQWRKESFCYACMVEAARRDAGSAKDPFKDDLELAGAYWCEEFPQMSDRTRSSIISTVTGTLDTLNRGYLRQLFSGETNFTPDMLADGKILIHTMSVKEFGEVGAMSQVVMKFAAQKAIERRDIRKSPRPVFLHLDEFQTLITSSDSLFATTCRSARAAMVLATQTLPTVYGALGGGDQAKQEVNSLLANMNLKVFCANSDPDTTKYAAELIGKVSRFTVNASRQRGDGFNTQPGHSTAGVSESMDFELQSSELCRLRTGGPDNRYCVDAILHRTGTPFRSTGRNWMRTTFSQR